MVTYYLYKKLKIISEVNCITASHYYYEILCEPKCVPTIFGKKLNLIRNDLCSLGAFYISNTQLISKKNVFNGGLYLKSVFHFEEHAHSSLLE